MSEPYALIDSTGKVVNVIVADATFQPPSGETMEPIGASGAGIGWSYAKGAFVAPVMTPPTLTAAQKIQQDVASAFAAGLAVTCTSTPALNGTYAVDQAAQQRINAIETAILKNGAFPGSSGTQLAYPKIDGTMVVFPSTAIFSEFATAVANYVADLDLYAAGAAGASMPSPTVTIA